MRSVEELQEYMTREAYEKDKLRFRCGKQSRFAENALKVALYDERDREYESALYNLLEAKAAVVANAGKRIGGKDKMIITAIDKAIVRVKSKLPKKYFVKDLAVSRMPLWIFAVLDQYKYIKVKLKRIEDDHYKIIVRSAVLGDKSKAIVVAPPLERAAVVCELRSDIMVHADQEHDADGVEFVVNGFNIGEDDELQFMLDDEVIMTIKNALYVLMEDDLR